MVEPIRDLESSTDELVKPRQMNIDTDYSLDTITRTPGRKIYADHPTNNIIIGQKTIHKDLMMPPSSTTELSNLEPKDNCRSRRFCNLQRGSAYVCESKTFLLQKLRDTIELQFSVLQK